MIKKNDKRLLSASFLHNIESYINDMCGFIKKKYDLKKVKIFIEKGENCYTDFFNIYIGSSFPIFDKMRRKKDAKGLIFCIFGVIFHEIGHLLFTPYSACELAEKHIYNGTFYPVKPSQNSEMITDYISKGEKEARRVYTAYNYLRNIIEDGRIENLLFLKCSNFYMFNTGLKIVRNEMQEDFLCFKECMDNLEAIADNLKPAERMREIYSLILQYSKYGYIKGLEDDDMNHPMIKTLVEIAEYIEAALSSTDADVFYKNLNEIFAYIFPDYLLPYFETIKDEEDSPQNGSGKQGTPQSSSAVKNALDSVVENQASHQQTKGEEVEKTTLNVKQAISSSISEDENNTSNSNSASDEEDEESGGYESGNSNEIEVAGSTEIKRTATNKIWCNGDGSINYSEVSEDEVAALDLESITAAETHTEDVHEIDTQLSAPLSIDYGEYNRNVPFDIQRVTVTASNKEERYQSFNKFIDNAKIGKRRLAHLFTEDQKDHFIQNVYYGSKLNSGKLARPDKRFYSKKVIADPMTTYSVSILVDQSGSMSGTKIEVVRGTAIFIRELLSSLNVNHAILGHCEDSYSRVAIRHYCLFGENEDKAKYNLLGISAGGCNRDGAALRYAAEQINQQNTDRKLLIIISDGQPNADGYSGTAAEADIRNVIKEYERKGIHFLAAAIDADKERIKHIYGEDRYLEINDIETLPQQLEYRIRKFMR